MKWYNITLNEMVSKIGSPDGKMISDKLTWINCC